MKRLLPIVALVLIIAMLCSACGTRSAQKDSDPAEVTESAAVTDNGQTANIPDINGSYEGQMPNQEKNEIDADIHQKDDGTYVMDIDIDQIGEFSQISVYKENGRLYFNGIDPEMNPIHGYLRIENGAVTAIFENSTYGPVPQGTEMYLSRVP